MYIKEYYDTNVNGTRNILDLALKNNAFVIYVSTAAIYGSPNSPISEDAEILPNGDYAKTKWLGEKICEEYKTKGLEISTVRPSVLVGKKRLGIYKIIFKNLFKNSFLPILGDGSNKISFVDIEDFCGFLISLTSQLIFSTQTRSTSPHNNTFFTRSKFCRIVSIINSTYTL